MFNLLKIEFSKLKSSKIFYFMILLNIIQAVFIYCFSENLRLMGGKQSMIYMFKIQSNLMLNISIGLFVSDYIVTEFTSGYMKNLISYGHKRISVFMSKSVVCFVGVITISFSVPLMMMVVNTIRNGYGEVFSINSLTFVLRLFFTLLFIYIAIGSIYILAAFAARNANITIGVIIALDLTDRIFNIIIVQKTVMSQIYNKIIFSQPGNILLDKAGVTEIFTAVVISLITILITNAAGIHIFKKADIK